MKLKALVITFIILNNIYAQSNDECKYFQVLTYIKTNVEFKNQLTKHLNLIKVIRKEASKEFNVTPWIEFIEIREFKDSVNADNVQVPKDILSNERLYYQTYNFDAYESVFLKKVIPINKDSKLYLTFSRVIGSTLLVEILNSDNQPHRVKRIGSGVKILFIFDQSGIINRAFFNLVYYN